MITWSVTDITEAIQQLLDHELGSVAVEGEISRLTRAKSGHWYFSLVDGGATLNAAMFRGNNRYMKWTPREGDKVLAVGGIDVYAPTGRYSLIVRRMEPSGEGARARALEELKRRLAAEGLFDADRKRQPPWLPKSIGVVTSPTGAALQDIRNVIWRRFPGMPIVLAPCRVQGSEAPAEIAEAISLMNDHGMVDVMIVGRGGGSVEDLWAFNEEIVVRAVADSNIPVISAVGHETDTSLSDLAADLRAPTPSAAAELAVPEQAALIYTVEQLHERAFGAISRAVEQRRRRLGELRLLHPGARLKQQRTTLEERQKRLVVAANATIERSKSRLGAAAGALNALSPLAVLSRGYGLVTRGEEVITSSDQLAVGDTLSLRLSRGGAEATVTSTTPPNEATAAE